MADYMGDITDGDDPKTLHMNVIGRFDNCPEAQQLRAGDDAIYFDDRATAAAHGYTRQCRSCNFVGF
jgi:hypothetical protein